MCSGDACFWLPSTFFPIPLCQVPVPGPSPRPRCGHVHRPDQSSYLHTVKGKHHMRRSGSSPGAAKMGVQLRLLVIPFLIPWREPVSRRKPSRDDRDGRQTSIRRDLRGGFPVPGPKPWSLQLCLPSGVPAQTPSQLHEP